MRCSFEKSKVVISIKNKNVLELLNSSQIQKQFAKALNVAQEKISVQLQAMGTNQEVRRWVPHQWDDSQMEKRNNYL